MLFQLEAEPVATARLLLTPLQVDDAAEMTAVLSDTGLYDWIGGAPPSLEWLSTRYQHLVAGSGNLSETWLNWIVRTREGNCAVGTLQATVVERELAASAWIAWIIGAPWQGNGYATEAARGVVTWLANHDLRRVEALIAPGHLASAEVARRAGFATTTEQIDGEDVWRFDLIS